MLYFCTLIYWSDCFRATNLEEDYLEIQTCFNGCMELIKDILTDCEHLHEMLEFKNINELYCETCQHGDNMSEKSDCSNCIDIDLDDDDDDDYEEMGALNYPNRVQSSKLYEKLSVPDTSVSTTQKRINFSFSVKQDQKNEFRIIDGIITPENRSEKTRVNTCSPQNENVYFIQPVDTFQNSNINKRKKKSLGGKYQKYIVQQNLSDEKSSSTSSCMNIL